MVRKKTQMIVGYYKNKKQALQAAKDFRKGSSNDIKPFYSIFYRVEKPKKNAKSWKVVSTLKPKKTNVQKQKEKGRKKFAKRKFTTGNERVQNARRRGKAPSQRKYKR